MTQTTGIMDFTGELGRFAVLQATKREIESVKQCLTIDSFIGRELERLVLPDKTNRKRSEFRRNMTKLETLIYELSLTKAGKGRVVDDMWGIDGKEDKDKEDESTV